MAFKRREKTFKGQLFIYFSFAMALVCVILCDVLYGLEYNAVVDNMEADTESNMYYAVSQVDNTALRVEEFANQLCRDEAVAELLRRDTGAVDSAVLDVAEELDNQFQFVTITEDILSLLLVGENGLDVRRGREASMVDYEEVVHTFCDQDYYGGSLMRWGTVRENFCRFSEYQTIVPYSRRIVDVSSGENLGYLILLLRETAFVDACTPFLSGAGEAFCLIDSTGQPVAHNAAWEALAAQYGGEGTVFDGSTMQFPAQQTLGGMAYRFFQAGSSTYEWRLVEAMPLNQFAQQTKILSTAAVMAVLLALVAALVLATVFSRQLARPLQRMVDAVEDIARGNFDRRLERDRYYELARLESSIDKMQGDLKQLVSSRVAQEQEKKAAEIQMLKAQINPHFLYNTLNSIKMMAVMQGARGIQSMTEALGSILRASLSNAEELTTLRDELDLLEQYIYIQNIRYKGNIEYEVVVRDKSLLDFKMQRFLLQPLLENAITHGIERENRGGRITLTAWRRWDSLYIAVEDNGAGIPPDRLERLQRGERLTSRSIGLHNVDQRLRMTYGDPYGLRFESRPGEFTRITARLKITEEETDREENPDTDC